MLEVFATSRAVRSFYETFNDATALLPKAITIAELEQKAVLVPRLCLVDEDMRVLLMQEASRFTQFELLHIEREFFTFLKNSTYLFRFFEELSHEKVALESLMQADTYEHYAEHLEVLKTLLKHYKAQLSKHSFYDRITLPECYELNSDYICSLGAVRIHLEGFLSRFEMELLRSIAELIPLHVNVTINAYNQKMARLFRDFGMELEHNNRYEIDLSSKKILHVKPQDPTQNEKAVFGFSSRLAQISYVQSTIAQFVEEGLNPEEIVVVLPDERFSEVMRPFDTWHNLNFAMGISLKQSQFYQKLSALEKAMRNDEIEDHLRLNRLKIESETLLTCKELWHQKISSESAMHFFESLLAQEEKEQKNPLFQEAFFAFTHFLKHAPALRFEQVTKLLLNRLGVLAQDDVRGGKVTVLGVLETRGVAYKGVIVVDFNDEFVPKRSQKDLFLSSAVRAHAGLPTKRDRENLQRYYYHQLFSRAQKVAIAYVKNETSMPSRFLDELGFDTTMMADEKVLQPLLFERHAPKALYEQPFIDAPHDLKAFPLSATKLKTVLTCKRQFYFRYLAHLKEAKMPSSVIDEQTIGIALHKVLEDAICDEALCDEKSLYNAIETRLKEQNKHEVWGYFVDLWLEKLRPFMRHEVARFEEGFSVFKKEFSHRISYEGFTLEGQMDRIDQKGDELLVIDYKSGKVPTTSERTLESTVDFQLVFYALIAGDLGKVAGVYYYDLKEGVLVEDGFLEEKKALLHVKLLELAKPINGYELCDEIKHCRLCPYVQLCGREEQI
ncbi:PD-(D/E)XK nuclease family protein [Sulfurospirillum cavolei]|uniref:PD-(D/E)XK nuclease family protein n=1 Tax=Sulfurospirillum cavolei TaxID=366522 RepID=UPI0005A83007|nr:PD-(D/E)XK nuclease family protein [Sulfurospirillum cavolei]